MARAVDSDWLWFQVVSAFDEEAKADYDGASYAPATKWNAKPWYFQNSTPLGGFLRAVEERLLGKVPALDGFRIPKGQKDIDPLVSQAMSQTAHYVYGAAMKFLASAPDVKLG